MGSSPSTADLLLFSPIPNLDQEMDRFGAEALIFSSSMSADGLEEALYALLKDGGFSFSALNSGSGLITVSLQLLKWSSLYLS